MRLPDRPARRMTKTLAFTFALAACGGKAPAPPAPDTTPAVDVAPEVAPPPSKLDEGKALLERPLERSGIEGAIAMADALAQEGTPEAKRLAARIRLAAVAKDLAGSSGDGRGAGGLGREGADRQLGIVLGAAEGEGEDERRIRIAALALKRLLGDKATPWPEARELATLESGDQPEAVAVRLARLTELTGALADSRGFDALRGTLGPFVCTGCGDVLGADVTSRSAKDRAGLACAAPSDAPWCEALLALGGQDALARLAPNALAIAGLELAHRAAGGSGWVGDAIAALQRGLEPVALPVPVALGDAPALGTVDLGRAVLEARPALVVAHLGAEAVRIGVRPFVTAGGKVVASPAGALLADAPGTPYAALAEVEPAAETGAIAGVTDRFQVVRDTMGKTPSEGPEGLAGDRGAVLLAIDPAAPPAAVAKVADGILAGGEVALRVLRPSTPGEVLPLFVRALPGELEDALVPAWETPMIVVVGKDTLEVWAPGGPKDGAVVVDATAANTLPTSLEQGWRKDKLARLSVRLPPAESGDRVGPSELKALADGVRVFVDQAKAGRVVHIVAGDDATSGEVLAVARHLQEVGLEPAPELGRVAEIWPGSRCAAGAEGCAGAVAVAFSRAAAPSARGLTAKPGSKDKKDEPKEVKPEPGPAPSAEFCNQADIKAQMNKKAGSFRFCYERELQLEKDLAGRLVMQFVIGLQGQVKSVRIASSELKNAKVGECIKKEIGKIQFKAPDGGECVVQYPFKFTAN